jgi:hypothetical protein
MFIYPLRLSNFLGLEIRILDKQGLYCENILEIHIRCRRHLIQHINLIVFRRSSYRTDPDTDPCTSFPSAHPIL